MAIENKPMKEQQGPNNEQQGSTSGGQSKFRFRNYDLIRRIDVGGMGEVYLARQHTAFDREVALKIIRSDLVHDVTARKRFLREAEVNAHLKHGHILSLVEFGEEEGRLFFVTPYVAGGTLARRLQAGPLSLAEVYQLFTALVQAIAYIHRQGVVHRDLKPNNILLDQEGSTGQIYIYLIDFGIASIQGMAASPPLTSAGTEVGTVAYMAPERLSGVAAPSNDIYSLGVILYQMLTGKLPADEQRITLPQPLEYVVNKCIATRPEDRFTTAEEVLNAFEYTYQRLKAARPPKVATSVSSLHGTGPVIIPNRANTPRPAGSLRQEVKTLQRADNIPPQSPNGFNPADYGSPTVDIDISKMQQGSAPVPTPLPVQAPLQTSPPKRRATPKRRRNSLFALITTLIVFVLLAMAGLSFFVFQSTVVMASANVNFGPWATSFVPQLPVESFRYLTASLMASGGTLMPALRAARRACNCVMVTEPSSNWLLSLAET